MLNDFAKTYKILYIILRIFNFLYNFAQKQEKQGAMSVKAHISSNPIRGVQFRHRIS